MTVRFRLGDEDAAKYAYGDEWYDFDEVELIKMPASKLIALETEMDYTVGELQYQLGRRSTQAMKAALWIARKLVHPDIEKYRDFDPIVWATHIEMSTVEVDAEADAVPLDPGPLAEDQSLTSS